MRLFKSLPVVAVVLLVTIGSALAQVDQSLEIGLKPYGSYHGGDLDSISLTNGNLTLHIPLTSYPQRGALGYTPRIVYNNKGGASFQTATQLPELAARTGRT